MCNRVPRLTALLLSRFLLNLQSASLRAIGSISPSQVSSVGLDHSLVFERVVGSLGASIALEDYQDEVDLGPEDDNDDREATRQSGTLQES